MSFRTMGDELAALATHHRQTLIVHGDPFIWGRAVPRAINPFNAVGLCKLHLDRCFSSHTPRRR